VLAHKVNLVPLVLLAPQVLPALLVRLANPFQPQT
jgi:hypothetical protein